MSNKCAGLSGWLFGHAFEPVFNSTPTGQAFTGDRIPISAIPELTKWHTKTTYVCSVCRRCGHTIKEAK